MTMIEKMARAIFGASGEAEPDDWDEIDGKRVYAWEVALPEAQTALTAIEQAGYKVVPVEPTEEMWGGLARDIMMWLDMYDGHKKTPRNLFNHLDNLGREIPDWLREGEMAHLDHVPSKGTRCYIIYRAMLAAAPEVK